MTYVVAENCIKCKYTDCVEVCPVDCFHEGPNFLVIDPEECIDCNLCVAECPAQAIFPEDDVPAGQEADQDALDHVGLPDDDLAHLGGERVDEGALLGNQLVQRADVMHKRGVSRKGGSAARVVRARGRRGSGPGGS